MKEVSFKAPWGAPLALMTAVGIVSNLLFLLLGVTICFGNNVVPRFLEIPIIPRWVGWLLVAAVLLFLVVIAAFMVRGYVLTDVSLIIKRLGWQHRLDLSRLNSATADPDALQGSFRIFSTGGFFSFAGLYRNKRLGLYRAFATDAKRAVVLRFANKTVVITPDDPQKFVAEISSNQRTTA